MSAKPKLLPTKPGRDPDRRAHQAQVKQAFLTGQTWGLTYLLARVRDRQPYDNYRVPDDIRQFEFTVKGVLRLEMMAQEAYKGWRRMFGSNTKARELSTWRSRILLRAFGSLAAARAYIEADPLLAWDSRPFPWPDDAPHNAWYVLFQVQDVRLSADGRRLTDLLADFLGGDSALLTLVTRHDVLPPAKGGDNG